MRAAKYIKYFSTIGFIPCQYFSNFVCNVISCTLFNFVRKHQIKINIQQSHLFQAFSFLIIHHWNHLICVSQKSSFDALLWIQSREPWMLFNFFWYFLVSCLIKRNLSRRESTFTFLRTKLHPLFTFDILRRVPHETHTWQKPADSFCLSDFSDLQCEEWRMWTSVCKYLSRLHGVRMSSDKEDEKHGSFSWKTFFWTHSKRRQRALLAVMPWMIFLSVQSKILPFRHVPGIECRTKY